jgi:hypothetical protein
MSLLRHSSILRSHIPALILLGALALPACSESEPDLDAPGLELAGIVQDTLGVPIAGASVWVRIWDNTPNPRGESTLITGPNGHFSGSIPVNTLLELAQVQFDVEPPLGSGWSRGFEFRLVPFDEAGRAEISGVDLRVIRREPPVPEGPPAPLAAADLAGDYTGQTVHPTTIVGGVYLDLTLTSAGNSVAGRYDIDFDASTVCGDSFGSVTGAVQNDTLFLRLTSDSFPGWNNVPLVNDFIVTTYAPGADTLILTYPQAVGDCPWGSPAPLRLIRP